MNPHPLVIKLHWLGLCCAHQSVSTVPAAKQQNRPYQEMCVHHVLLDNEMYELLICTVMGSTRAVREQPL